VRIGRKGKRIRRHGERIESKERIGRVVVMERRVGSVVRQGG
jgi:hypothetical protein